MSAWTAGSLPVTSCTVSFPAGHGWQTTRGQFTAPPWFTLWPSPWSMSSASCQALEPLTCFFWELPFLLEPDDDRVSWEFL